MEQIMGVSVSPKKINVKNLNWEARKTLCEEWKRTKLSASAFCKERGLAGVTFHKWCKQLWPDKQNNIEQPLKIERRKTTKLSKNNWFPVTIADSKSSLTTTTQISAEIILPNQMVMRILVQLSDIKILIKELCNANTTRGQ